MFYIVALFVAGLLAGLLAPRPLWAHYLGALVGQLGYEVLFLSIGPLFVLGALFLVAYSCIFLAGAAVAGRFRGRIKKGVANGRAFVFRFSRSVDRAGHHKLSVAEDHVAEPVIRADLAPAALKLNAQKQRAR